MFLLSIIINIALIFFFISISKKINLLDTPNSRKIHTSPVPLVGGISIYLTIFILIFLYDFPNVFEFSILILGPLVLIGLLDDLFEIQYYIRIILQITLILLVMNYGVVIRSLDFNFIYNFYDLKNYGLIITFICILGLVNAINFIDGIDGLSSGSLLISFLSVLFYALYFNVENNFEIIVILILLLTIFIFFNLRIFNLPIIFLGDAGSASLGFLLACTLIIFSQSPYNYFPAYLVPWCITLPIFDLLYVSINRILKNQNPFKPDKSHIHFLLISIGFSHIHTLFVLLFLQILFSLLGFIIAITFPPFFSLLTFVFVFLILFYITKIIENNSKKLSK